MENYEMSIPFITVERGRPGHPEVPVKYYPSLQSKGRVTLHELAEEASDMSTLTTADMAAAIEALLILIPEHLAQGEVVELGDFGNIWLRFSAEGVDDPKKVSGKQITTLIPRLMAGKRFLEVLAQAEFKKLR